jgi:HlyD family secretion protein
MTSRLSFLAIALLATACASETDPNTVRLNGRLESPLVDLAPKVAGRVVEVLVKEGDRVEAGDLLIRLDLGDTAIAVDRDRSGVASARARLGDLEVGNRRAEIAAVEAEVNDRQAAVDLAMREVARQEFLVAKEVGAGRDLERALTELDRATAALRISEERLKLAVDGFRRGQTEQARSEVDRALAELRQSETIARESEIRAPAAGIVLHRMAEPGQLLSAGQTGLTLAFADRLYVRTFVPEPSLGKVRQGQPATIVVDAYPGKQFQGVVTEISPDPEYTPKAVETRNERINLVYAAKVDLSEGWNAALVPGQPAEIAVVSGAVEPQKALASGSRQE